MTIFEVFARIEEVGIIPAVRVPSQEDALFASRAVFEGGIPIVEITMTVPGALDVIAELRQSHPEAIVGAGTVLDVDTAHACRISGATFMTSTGLDPDLLDFGKEHDLAIIPGALTPTEVIVAKKAGADFIKIYPCSAVGGASYMRALKGPFPGLRFIATGGVNQQTAADFIRSGASAIGVGQDLLPRDAIRARNSDWIRELARRFTGMVQEGRKNK